MNETTVENIGTVYESMMQNQRTYLANQDNKQRLEDVFFNVLISA